MRGGEGSEVCGEEWFWRRKVVNQHGRNRKHLTVNRETGRSDGIGNCRNHFCLPARFSLLSNLLTMGIIEILLFIAILLFILCYNINRMLGLPPGPTPWPIVGNVLQLPMIDLDKRVLELRKQYGGVFTLWIPYPTVIIAEHEALKRTVVRDGDAYAGRPSIYLMELLFGGNYGLSFEENDWYRSQRRFTLHTLRNLGVGKPIIKDTITMLSNRTVDLLRKTNGRAIELKPYLTVPEFIQFMQLTD
ncbi:hypothetical protein Y032_0002g687 [Ancylostoma ceylanicum]|uniref:Unspecific monooxygenase n=1 Tax=Ancylostoma ceylanicum TaxID=53326 RepID=A0A016W076_9BILA|nr:hypothetical protein Y032_0002g687 [Ancylostoma ceylanicum]